MNDCIKNTIITIILNMLLSLAVFMMLDINLIFFESYSLFFAAIVGSAGFLLLILLFCNLFVSNSRLLTKAYYLCASLAVIGAIGLLLAIFMSSIIKCFLCLSTGLTCRQII